MPITKDMVTSTSRWAKVRDDFEKAYDKFTKEKFLDMITTAYILKEVDLELERQLKERHQ